MPMDTNAFPTGYAPSGAAPQMPMMNMPPGMGSPGAGAPPGGQTPPWLQQQANPSAAGGINNLIRALMAGQTRQPPFGMPTQAPGAPPAAGSGIPTPNPVTNALFSPNLPGAL